MNDSSGGRGPLEDGLSSEVEDGAASGDGVFQRREITIHEYTAVVKESYSGAMRRDSHCKKEQGVIIEDLKDLDYNDVVDEIANIVEPQNIGYVSRISNNRISVFLSSADLAEKFVMNNRSLEVNNKIVKVRSMVIKHKRVLLANVSPIIPHSVIEGYLESIKVRRGSGIAYIKAGLTNENLQHVKCNKRVVYVHPDDLPKLPGMVKIHFEGDTHNIFLRYDEVLRCFRCSNPGHIARFCPLKDKDGTIYSQSNAETTLPDHQGLPSLEKNQSLSTEKPELLKENSSVFPTDPPSTVFKKPLPLLVDTKISGKRTARDAISSSTSSADTSGIISKMKQKKKKKKIDVAITEEKVKKQIQTASTKITAEMMETFPFSYDKLVEFIVQTYEVTYDEVLPTAQVFSINTNAIAIMMEKIYEHITDPQMKTRFTRISKKLVQPELMEGYTSDENNGTDNEDKAMEDDTQVSMETDREKTE